MQQNVKNAVGLALFALAMVESFVLLIFLTCFLPIIHYREGKIVIVMNNLDSYTSFMGNIHETKFFDHWDTFIR